MGDDGPAKLAHHTNAYDRDGPCATSTVDEPLALPPMGLRLCWDRVLRKRLGIAGGQPQGRDDKRGEDDDRDSPAA